MRNHSDTAHCNAKRKQKLVDLASKTKILKKVDIDAKFIAELTKEFGIMIKPFYYSL